MRVPGPAGSGHVLRPIALLAMVYFGVCSLWWMWILANARHPALGEPKPRRLVSDELFLAVSAFHLLLLAALATDAVRCRRSPPGLRRGHWAGLGLAVVVLALLQLGFGYAHAGLPFRG